MSITKLIDPSKVALAGNPIVFRLQTDNMYEVDGESCRLVLSINAQPVNGETFMLSWANNSITFTFVDVVSDDPTELHTDLQLLFGNLEQFAVQMAGELNQHYLLSRDFYIQAMENKAHVEFIARVKGDIFDLAFTLGTAPLTSYSFTSGVTSVPRPHYYLFMQIYLKQSTGMLLIGKDMLPPDNDGIAEFDISEYFHPEFSYNFSWPMPVSFITKHTGLMLQYEINYGEVYGAPQSFSKLQNTSSYSLFALGGGIDFMLQANYNEKNTSFWQKLRYNWQFLTWQPTKKTIFPWQIEKLFFLIYPQCSVVKLIVEVYYKNTEVLQGTPQLVASYNVNQFDVVEISFTYETLPLSLYPGEQVDYIRVYISDQNNIRISESRFYQILDRPVLYKHEFIFRNSLGAYDTVLFTGVSEFSGEYDRKIYSSINKYDFVTTDPMAKVQKVLEDQKITASTGWFEDKEKAEWLRELLLSKEVYEVVNEMLFPIVITSGEVFIRATNTTLYALSIECYRAYTDEHFSKNAYLNAIFLNSFNASFITP